MRTLLPIRSQIAGLITLVLLITVFTACSTKDPNQQPVQQADRAVEDKTVTMESQSTPVVTTPSISPQTRSVQETSTAGQDLGGLFYYIGFDGNSPNLIAMDPASGSEKVLFAPPENSWLSELAISPDGSQLLLAYSPPPEEGQIQYGFTDLYLMPVDGSASPALLLEGEDPSETYFNISWPVAETIYFAHFAPTFADDGLITYGSQVERLHLPESITETLALGAAWPRVSNDGTMLVYVNDDNELILADSTGAEPIRLLDPETFSAVDAPIFSPDNSQICFSAVEPKSASSPSFIGRLLGLKIAYAHNVPSDWYCLLLDSGGEAVRLTYLDALGIYGDFSADGRYLAFMTSTGVYIMETDGSEPRQLQERALAGTLNWAP